MNIETMLFILVVVAILGNFVVFFCLTLLFKMVYSNRIIITENNGEIRVHDKAMVEIENKLKELVKEL